MAEWVDNLARRFGYAKNTRGASPASKFAHAGRQPGRRDFAGSVNSRLTGGWNTQNISANADLYRNLDILRARSQDLCNNNDYAKRFLNMVGANVIGGTGVMLQARIYDTPNKPDTGANDAVETAWQRWGALGTCEVTGRLSWRDLQNIAIKCVARDGECLIRIVRGKAAGNAFGFALQLLDINRLDTKLIRIAEGSTNQIKMGVELDSYGRAVAFWLRDYNPAEMWLTAGNVSAAHIRVPAADVLHVFTNDRPEQVRGLPWMHSAMVRLNNLGGYEEAAVIAARVGAAKMGFFTTPEGGLSPVADGEDEDDVPFLEADAGSFGKLPPGYEFQSFNPDYPHAMYGEFVRACLRGIASGLGVTYHGLANDLTQVNFSSIRSGTLEERDQWIGVQEWFKDSFCEPIFTEWIKSALAFGQITLANGSALPIERLEKFSAHTWQARRWQWVDPLKDMEANVLAVQEGFKSPQAIAAEMGVDYEDVLVQIKQAQDLAKKIGVELHKPEKTPPPGVVEPAVAAAKEHAAAQVRVAEINRDAAREAKPHVINITPPSVTVNQGETRIANHLPAPVTHVSAPDVRVDVEAPAVQVTNEITERAQPAPIINVAAPEVTVEVEAIMPAQSEIAITSMPDRQTTSTITRDSAGNIKQSSQIEQDA
jgi:lambda family phage portal protein